VSADRTTPRAVYLNRRQFVGAALGSLALGSRSMLAQGGEDLAVTPYKLASSYNNYYEFSQNKEAIKVLAQALTVNPWRVSISGAVENPGDYAVDELLSNLPVVSRIYRFRCVEGWSMVVPWQGVQLKDVLARAKPLPGAGFVSFTSIDRPSEMIGQRRSMMPWPYVEALRLDEAMHSLTLLATGMYDRPLPKQNGAPLRLVVPWKYGYKSIKAIAGIHISVDEPSTTWSDLAPSEYGFFGNVNPALAHPRWSQRREVRLGEVKKRPTLMFNGYEAEVQHLYSAKDITRF